jgi:hypothetical protein
MDSSGEVKESKDNIDSPSGGSVEFFGQQDRVFGGFE